MLQPLDILIQTIFTGQFVTSGEMVDSLMRKHSLKNQCRIHLKYVVNMYFYLKRMRFWMDSCPHQIVIGIGRMDLMETMGMAYLADEFGISVDRLEGQMVLLARQHRLRLR